MARLNSTAAQEVAGQGPCSAELAKIRKAAQKKQAGMVAPRTKSRYTGEWSSAAGLRLRVAG